MTSTFRPLILLVVITASASICRGHFGTRIVPIFELTDEMVEQIDIHDGSIEDWVEVVGEPTLTALDFVVFLGQPYNPPDFDFRLWLAWHRRTSHVYLAVQGADEVHVVPADGEVALDGATNLEIDADHSGGIYGPPGPDKEDLASLSEENQFFSANPYSSLEDPPVFVGWTKLTFEEECCWFGEPPFADGAGSVAGENPAIWITEMYVTPFDRLIPASQEKTERSLLSPGNVIGFRLGVLDDDAPKTTPPNSTTDSRFSFPSADPLGPDYFADGLLVPADETVASSVQSISWGRIKASLQP